MFVNISYFILILPRRAVCVSCLDLDVYGWCPCHSVLWGGRVNAELYLCWPLGAIKSHSFFISWVWPDFSVSLSNRDFFIILDKCRHFLIHFESPAVQSFWQDMISTLLLYLFYSILLYSHNKGLFIINTLFNKQVHSKGKFIHQFITECCF